LHPGSPQLWLSFHSSHILYSLPRSPLSAVIRE
jgi:hypothetical protein